MPAQREGIMAVFFLSRMLYFPVSSIGSLLVAKKRIVFPCCVHMLVAYWLLDHDKYIA